jgi:hypothetical protein
MPAAETTGVSEWPGGAADRRAPTDLLGVRVWTGGVCLGTVTAVIVDPQTDALLVAEVTGRWTHRRAFLPLQAARLQPGGLAAHSLAFLGPHEAAYYAQRGSVRVSFDGAGPFMVNEESAREGGR